MSESEYVVYFKSLGVQSYITSLAYTDGAQAEAVKVAEIHRLEKAGWQRVPNWVPADPAQHSDQVMLTCNANSAPWDAIVGIAPAHWFRALTV